MTKFPTFLLLLVLRFDFNVKAFALEQGKCCGKSFGSEKLMLVFQNIKAGTKQFTATFV